MSDEGEKICQICAEEMDLTDQQLKPCKCGYEICVWCWHQIMDMADKDESAGRCPACRTPYNKEKIVGTTASCGRLASDMNVEKRPKSSRGKNKSSEGRKQLANMRVIQRNLVYVVGLPLNMADEDLLHHREYFGQYGKVLKVSISRPTSGVIQPSVNSTCSVYITYSKEVEAVRCIQSVHGFFLDGKPLRACFGTTKYCHAWLRNAPCSNPDCLYLHEIGSQEDSFTKDEIVSAYTRVQQITGSTNSTQRRSGYMLPPPSDEYCNETSASSGKPINITAVNSNNTQISAKVSPTNSSSGRSALPAGASWGTRAANGLPLHSSKQCSNGVLKKSDASDGLVACSTAAASQMHQSSLHSDSAKILVNETDNMVSQDKSEAEALRPELKESNAIEKATLSQSSNKSVHPTTLLVNKQPLGQCTTKLPAVSINGVNSSLVSGGLVSGGDATDVTKEKMEKLAHSHCLPTSIQETETLDDDYIQVIGRTVTSQTSETTANTTEELDSRDAQSDFRLGMPRSRTPSPVTEFDLYDAEDDLLSFENQRLKDPEVAPNRNDSSHASHLSSHSDVNSTEQSKADSSIGSHLDRQAVDKICSFPIGRLENVLKAPGPDVNNAEYSNLSPTKRSLVGGYDGELKTDAFNLGESSIISDILSIDFDPWDESLTSPQDVAKLLGENNKQQGSFGVPGSWKHHGTNQSRFSFAREDENRNQASGFGQSVDCFTYGSNSQSFGNDNNFRLDKLDSHYGFPLFNGMESDIFPGSHSHMSSNRLPVSRPHVSAPPGFSVPSKTPPPGFTSHDRANQMFDVSGNHLLNANSVLRHNYQTPAFGNTISNEDIELIDPAILAVGKGLLPGGVNSSVLDDLNANYFSQFNAYEEAKFQSILQRSLPSHQSHRFASPGESFSPLGNTYSMPSTVMEQTLANNMSRLSQFTLPQSRNGMISNGQRDGWNELQAGNNLVMTEILRNERSGFNKFYDGYEDSKIRMPNSGNLFNGTYGI